MPLVTKDSTQANVFIGPNEPNGNLGDLWSDTTTNLLKKHDGSSFEEFIGSDSPEDSQFASTKKTDTTTTREITDSEFTSPTTATATSALASENLTIDFSNSTGWTLTGVATISDGKLSYNNSFNSPPAESSYEVGALYDLGSAFSTNSGTSFKIRFKLTETSSGTSGNGRTVVVGLFSATNLHNVGTKYIGIQKWNTKYHVASPNFGKWEAVCEHNNTAYHNVTGSANGTTTVLSFTGSTGSELTRYIEIERTSSSNVVFKIYSDEYTTLVTTTTFSSVNSSVANLRYFLVGDPYDNFYKSTTLNTSYDDLTIFNAVTYSATNVNQTKTTPTNERWQTSSSEINPSITVDMNTTQELLGVAIYPHSNTNITSFKIETSSDNVTFLRRKTLNYSSLTVGAYNFIYFPRPPTTSRYLKLTGLDASAKTFSLHKVVPLVLSESEINRRHRIITYTPSDTAASLTGA